MAQFHDYKICAPDYTYERGGVIRLSRIMSKFDSLGMEYTGGMKDLLARGAWYSNMDFDVLSGAVSELRRVDPNVYSELTEYWA